MNLSQRYKKSLKSQNNFIKKPQNKMQIPTINPLITILLTLSIITTDSKILQFDTHTIQKTFQSRAPTLFLFTNDNKQSKQARKIFQQFDQVQQFDIILTVSDQNDGHGLFGRLTSYLGVKRDELPQALFIGQQQEKYYYQEGVITVQGLKRLVKIALNHEEQPDIKSEPVPENNDEYVKIAVGSTFKSMILQSNKEFLIDFYTPWCQHCKLMAPAYEQAAKKLQHNPNLQLIKLDASKNEVVGLEISGYPAIKFYQKDKSKGPINYTGGLTANQIIDWLKRHVYYQWVPVIENSENSANIKVVNQEKPREVQL